MRTSVAVLLTVVLPAVLMNPASADVLNMGGTRNADGSWNGLASLETVPVGDAGNIADTRVMQRDETSGYGAVGYAYRIGKYEVTTAQYCEFLNKVAGVDTYSLYNTSMWSSTWGCGIERFAGNGTTVPYQYRVTADYANRPVNYVSWGDAARFANWLSNGQPTGVQESGTTETGLYTLNGATSNVALMAISRNPGVGYAIPSEDEWYKAAYYQGGTMNAGYWLYPTRSNSVPRNDLLTPDGGNNANSWQGGYTIDSPYYRTLVGEFENSDSPYGTFDQGGNVWEWNEAILSGSFRGLRGGSFNYFLYDDYYLQSSFRSFDYHTTEDSTYGFRIVQVPEPATFSLLALGGLLLARRRRA